MNRCDTEPSNNKPSNSERERRQSVPAHPTKRRNDPRRCPARTQLVKFCVGGTNRTNPAIRTADSGLFHAVRVSEAFGGTSLCGERVTVWPGSPFPTRYAENECRLCRAVVEGAG